MRSRLICSLASAALLLSFACAREAKAETTRVRISIDELPLQDKPLKIDAKSAVLPNGVRDGGAVPKSWREQKDGELQMENARCTDGRMGSVQTIHGGTTSTLRIWEENGKTWLDRVDVGTYWGKVEVKEAERVPLVRIADGLWGRRKNGAIVLYAASDNGFIEEGSFHECSIAEREIAAPGGTAILDSSPNDVNKVIKQIAQWNAEPGKPPKWQPAWTGVEYRIAASVSQASSDAHAILSLVIRKP